MNTLSIKQTRLSNGVSNVIVLLHFVDQSPAHLHCSVAHIQGRRSKVLIRGTDS